MKNRLNLGAGMGHHAEPISSAWSTVVAIIATILAFASPSAVAQKVQQVETAPQKQESVMPQLGDIETRGKQLRVALDEIYAALPTWKKPKFNVVPITPAKDISDVVRQYIPPGSSFDEAEAVLRSAGFTIVRPRKTEVLPSPGNVLPAYDVAAELAMTADKPAELMGVRVLLRPIKIMDYEIVAEVFSRIEKKADR